MLVGVEGGTEVAQAAGTVRIKVILMMIIIAFIKAKMATKGRIAETCQ